MRTVYADTSYWVALLNSRDGWHDRALDWSRRNPYDRLVTCDEVLTKLLNYFSCLGPSARSHAAGFVRTLLHNPAIDVFASNRDLFLSGLSLYESRLDKGYSLVDCIGMSLMRVNGLDSVLTTDSHFRQEGFQLPIPQA
jgi:predicted nucleic acid-binding protein